MMNFTLPAQPLPDSDIHVWYASLNVSSHDLSRYRSLLSQDETDRAMRFVFEKDRSHYIVGRGLLRLILAGYLGLDPARLEFVYGKHGKPALQSDPHLEFNLSHSNDIVLYAFNWNRRIGVDVEYLIPMADMDDFAEQFFTLRESAWINSLSGKQKEDAFFKTWTCKEAFLKANGSGLTVPINQVEISLETDGTVELLAIGDDQDQAANWGIKMFDPLSGYQAALAVEGHGGQIILRRLNDPMVK
jgi:4'-phosphopantetheinyl transferase